MHTPKKLPGLRICARCPVLDGGSGPGAPLSGLGGWGLPDPILLGSGARDPNFPEDAGTVLDGGN